MSTIKKDCDFTLPDLEEIKCGNFTSPEVMRVPKEAYFEDSLYGVVILNFGDDSNGVLLSKKELTEDLRNKLTEDIPKEIVFISYSLGRECFRIWSQSHYRTTCNLISSFEEAVTIAFDQDLKI